MDRPPKHPKPDHRSERSAPNCREILGRLLSGNVLENAQMEFLLDHLEAAK